MIYMSKCRNKSEDTLDKSDRCCYYKKTERTLFFINDRKEVQYAKSIFIVGRQ